MNNIKKNKFWLLSLAILALIFSGCNSSPEEEITIEMIEKDIYDQAQSRLKSGNYALAILSLETLERQFPFGKYAEQAQSELIYAYYKNSSYDAAISAAERFISLHPRHPNTPYAFYLKGLAKFTEDQSFFGELPLLGDMTHKRDLSRAKESFDDLSEFLTRYPESEYAGNAKQRMVYLRNLIAKQEIYIAEYYIERKAYVAAVNRANYVIKHMSRTPEVVKALEISIIAYKELGKNDLVTDMNRDIYKLDLLEEGMIDDRIDEEEYFIGDLPEDDDYGDMDGDESYY